MFEKKKDFFDRAYLKELISQSFDDDQNSRERLLKIEDFAGSSLLGKKEPLAGEEGLSHAYGVAAVMARLGFGREPVYAAFLFLPALLSNDPASFIDDILPDLVDGDTCSLVRGIVRVFRIQLFRYDDPQHFDRQRIHVESFRQMILALVADIRVVVVVLASHLQTLRHLTTRSSQPFHTIFSKVILDVFAPLANRLGVWQLKWELEDLAFRFYKPDVYQSIARKIREKRHEREQFIQNCIETLDRCLVPEDMDYKIYGRAKHIYSIFSKMNHKGLDFSDLYDIHAIRILVPSVRCCYVVLGIVHGLWRPLPKEFDDYILQPKSNLYQSLHTVVQVNSEKNLEVQIRTFEMHQHAELGVAAHWRYKEKEKKASSYDEKISLLRRILMWRDDLAQKPMWSSETQRAALNQTIYVFTPQGKVISLPCGSTPIDFAYALHSEVGHRCRGAKVDGLIVPLDKPLETGQCVEILTAKQGGPSRDWLGNAPVYAVSHRARARIRQYFHHIDEDHAAVLSRGKELFLKKIGQLKRDDISAENAAAVLGFSDTDAFYHAICHNDISSKMWRHLLGVIKSPQVKSAVLQVDSSAAHHYSSFFSVMGVSGLVTRLAHCCHPIPGDEVIGFITKDHCVSVHRANCVNVQKLKQKNPERLVDVHCTSNSSSLWSYRCKIEILHSKEALKDVVDLFSRLSAGTVTQFLSSVAHDILTIHVVWKTTPVRYSELENNLKKIPGFIRFYRV